MSAQTGLNGVFSAMEGRAKLGAAGAVVAIAALVASLLATTSPANSEPDPSFFDDIGTLELLASTAGDGFEFRDATGAVTATESFTTNNRSRLSETNSPQNLVSLTPNDGATNQTYVGLKDSVFGVRDRGEGGGIPASQINGSQTLTIDLDGPDLPGAGASWAELALKFKFGATVRVEAFDSMGTVAAVEVTCDGGGSSDCGSDSGADRDVVRVPASGDAVRPFTSVVISIVSPSDGAVSLIDDPGFETVFNIVEEYDGILACEDDGTNTNLASDQDGADVLQDFTRVDVDLVVDLRPYGIDKLPGNVRTGCEDLIPYNQETDAAAGPSGEITFEPDASVIGLYRGDLTFPAGEGDDFFLALTESVDGTNFRDMKACPTAAVGTAGAGTEYENAEGDLANIFFEAGDPASISDVYPQLPDPSDGLVSCVVSYNASAGGLEHWVVLLVFDPRYR